MHTIPDCLNSTPLSPDTLDELHGASISTPTLCKYVMSTEMKFCIACVNLINHLTPLTSKRCILYIYSTNIGTEYFKHGIYSLFFSLQNAVCFIILTYLVPVLFTFYIQGVLKLKQIIIPAPKG